MIRRLADLARRARSPFTTALELAGFALITKGAWEFSEPLGFVVGGAALVLVAFLAGPPLPPAKKAARR